MSIDKKSLAEDLIDLVGADNVIMNEDALIKYGSDLFGGTHPPLMVIKPSSPPHFKRLNFILRRYKITSITSRGLGLDINLGAYSKDLIIDLTLLNKKVEIDIERLIVTAHAGISLANLQNELEKKGFRLPIEPLLNGTLGGFIATGGYGYGAYKNGTLMNYLRSTTLILSNGQILHTGIPNAPAYSHGYNMNSIICGSEGYIGTIIDADLEILPKAPYNQNILLQTNIDSSLQILSRLSRLSTIYNISLFKTLNMHNLSGFDLFIRLEGTQTAVEEEFSTIEEVSKENESTITEVNNLWENRLIESTQIPSSSIIITLIIPLKYIPQFLRFCEAFENPSFFGIFLNPSNVLLYMFLAKDIAPSRKNEILTRLKNKINEFEGYPPTIESNLNGFVQESYPNLALLKKLKPIFDKANRFKSGKFDF